MKQFPKQRAGVDVTAQQEIAFGRCLFPRDENGEVNYALNSQLFPGINHFTRLIDDRDDPKDIWLIYDLGPSSLSKHLYELKGEFYKGERLYHVHHQHMYQKMKEAGHKPLRQLIKYMAEALDALAECGLVHADLKPDNILVDYDPETNEINDVKLIDFGSSFYFETPGNIQATTPEYLAPEILEHITNPSKKTFNNIEYR